MITTGIIGLPVAIMPGITMIVTDAIMIANTTDGIGMRIDGMTVATETRIGEMTVGMTAGTVVRTTGAADKDNAQGRYLPALDTMINDFSQ